MLACLLGDHLNVSGSAGIFWNTHHDLFNGSINKTSVAFQERSRSLDEERCGSFTRLLHLRVPGMSRERLASLELLLAPLAPPSAINTSAPAAPPATLVLSLLPTHSLHSFSLFLSLSPSFCHRHVDTFGRVRRQQTSSDTSPMLEGRFSGSTLNSGTAGLWPPGTKVLKLFDATSTSKQER